MSSTQSRQLQRVDRTLNLSSKRVLYRLAIIVGLLLVWHLVGVFGWVDSFLISSPPAVGAAAFDILRDSGPVAAMAQTLQAVLYAAAIAAVAGIISGIIFGTSRLLRAAFYPAILFLMSTPKVVFVPLFMLMFGIGPEPVVAFGAFQAYFYVTVTVVGGIDTINSKHIQLMKAFNASPVQKYNHLIFPATSHALFASVWFAISQAFSGAIIVELFASAGGVGQLMNLYRNSLRADYLIALSLSLAAVAVLAGTLVSWIEKKATKWRQYQANSA